MMSHWIERLCNKPLLAVVYICLLVSNFPSACSLLETWPAKTLNSPVRFSAQLGSAASLNNSEAYVESIGIISVDWTPGEFSNQKVLHRVKRVITIRDPEWRNQWYLYRDPQTSLNVVGAWAIATGKGIVIGIVSTGINHKHEDLNVDKSLSYDFHPHIRRNVNSSGTPLAGIVAASSNQLCGIGVAFDAKIADIRLIQGRASDKAKGQALVKNLHSVDIYLNSWALLQKRNVPLETIPDVINGALQMGVSQGRNGKGALYVWDTGQNGKDNSCAYDPYINSLYTIPVAGVTKDGRPLQSGTQCAAILVSAYSKDSSSDDQIITTWGSESDSCTDSYGEASAASALVSGVIALALQTNPSLTSRDVLHLLVQSGDPDPFQRPNDFVINGAPLQVSSTFGFGIIDAAKMVSLAKTWVSVPNNTQCHSLKEIDIDGHWEIARSYIYIDPIFCPIRYLEHVEIQFNLSYSNGRGSAKLTLLSPSKTQSVIVPGRSHDQYEIWFNWTVMSVQFWGEIPPGRWQITVSESEKSGFHQGTARLLGWSLTLHGLTTRPLFPTYRQELKADIATDTEEFLEDEYIPPMAPPPWWACLLIGITVTSVVTLIVLGVMKIATRQRTFNRADCERRVSSGPETDSLRQTTVLM